MDLIIPDYSYSFLSTTRVYGGISVAVGSINAGRSAGNTGGGARVGAHSVDILDLHCLAVLKCGPGAGKGPAVLGIRIGSLTGLLGSNLLKPDIGCFFGDPVIGIKGFDCQATGAVASLVIKGLFCIAGSVVGIYGFLDQFGRVNCSAFVYLDRFRLVIRNLFNGGGAILEINGCFCITGRGISICG